VKEQIAGKYGRRNCSPRAEKMALPGKCFVIKRAGRSMAGGVAVNCFDAFQNPDSEAEGAFAALIKRIKRFHSLQLEKIILEMKAAVSKLHP